MITSVTNLTNLTSAQTERVIQAAETFLQAGLVYQVCRPVAGSGASWCLSPGDSGYAIYDADYQCTDGIMRNCDPDSPMIENTPITLCGITAQAMGKFTFQRDEKAQGTGNPNGGSTCGKDETPIARPNAAVAVSSRSGLLGVILGFAVFAIL